MKKILLLSSLVLAAALVQPAFAQIPSPANSDLNVVLASGASVARGMSREAVNLMLGTPDTTLAPGVWIYWNFTAKNVPHAEKLDTLVVVFTGDKVSNLRLCYADPVRAAIAKVKAHAAPKTVAAK